MARPLMLDLTWKGRHAGYALYDYTRVCRAREERRVWVTMVAEEMWARLIAKILRVGREADWEKDGGAAKRKKPGKIAPP